MLALLAVSMFKNPSISRESSQTFVEASCDYSGKEDKTPGGEISIYESISCPIGGFFSCCVVRYKKRIIYVAVQMLE